MNKLLLPALISAAAMSGCVESALNPDDAVVMSGTALRENKSPLTNATLALLRSDNSACVFTSHYKDVKTDSVGKYSLQLVGAETQNGEDVARCFWLQTPAGEKSAVAAAEFLMQVTQVDVPDLQVWNGAVQAAQASDGAQLTYQSIFQTHGFDSEVSFEVKKGVDVVWRGTASGSPVAIGGDLLEDFPGLTTRLTVNREVKGSGTTFHLHYLSDTVDLPQQQKVPASRGAACTFGAKSWDADCPYTDGNLALNPGEAAPQLTVKLPAAKKLRAVVLRNFACNIASQVLIEGSTDGGNTWITLGQLPTNAPTDFVEVTLDAQAPAVDTFRIDVQGNNAPKILQLAEVSAFE